MDADRWTRVNELFQATIEHPTEERSAFLAAACGDDGDLRKQVERLVRAHDRADGFLKAPAAAEAVRILAAGRDPSAGLPSLTAYRAGSDFRGTDRFTVIRTLGAGGMGVVYEVQDRERNEIVALKTMLRARAEDIFRLKREFRSLADVAHPNLVSLYELVVDDANCFFTMELVRGVTLVDFVRGSASDDRAVRAERARAALAQLVLGLSELHRRGKLHRDVKPSNVLVTAQGRVVILDFGLTSDVFTFDRPAGEPLAGTPAYLAPERHAGAPATQEADWYGVGVTLYEAVAGHLPSEPSFDDLPDDLAGICRGLLEHDPAERLSGSEVWRLLHGQDSTHGIIALEPETGAAFVGRREPLETLDAAWRRARAGQAVTVCIHGPSGIGKSALVESFLARAFGRDDLVVLRGRCYERESVPYKALDGVVDHLSQFLGAMPRADVDALLPSAMNALSRLFPVLLQVDTAAQPAIEAETADPIRLRQRAFGALRELFARLAAARPLVVFIDDLHWADADSLVLLDELRRPPDAPPTLTIACIRTEEIASKPYLKAMIEPGSSRWDVVIPLEPMSDAEARTLLDSLMPAGAPVAPDAIGEIAREAGGNPFLLRQLADYARRRPEEPALAATFGDMLRDRVERLPDGAREFLRLLAICGRPMAPQIVHAAAGLAGDERPLVAQLRASHLVRSSGSAERVELYHDRIRETLAAIVPADERRRLHGRVAETLLARGAADPEALYEHYRESGDRARASLQAGLAAKKADAALAFDRAAEYYRAALDLGAPADVRPGLAERLGVALANAGRPAEAADAFLAAAKEGGAVRRIELQRRAAEQLLIGGHIDRGLEVSRTVLRAVGVRHPVGPRASLAALVARRLQLRWRGFGFVERPADRVPPGDLLRIDTCGSVATGLALVDRVQSAYFHTRHLLLALDAGEPYRIARALAFDLGIEGTAGGAARRRIAECTERAEAMAQRVGHPQCLAVCALARGITALLGGEFRAAHAFCERAIALLRDQALGTTWELNSAQEFSMAALLLQGEMRKASRELPLLLAAARERGNLYFETELRTRMNLVWLAADNADEAQREAGDALDQWSLAGFHQQHYNQMLAAIQTELYRGRAEAAWQVVSDRWSVIERRVVRWVQFSRIEARYLRARCALQMARAGADSQKFLAIARGDAARIARERMAWSNPIARLLQACAAHLEGRTRDAAGQLSSAIADFERVDMNLYAAVAAQRLDQIASDERTRARRGRADEWMAAQGIVNPGAMARLIAPGFEDN